VHEKLTKINLLTASLLQCFMHSGTHISHWRHSASVHQKNHIPCRTSHISRNIKLVARQYTSADVSPDKTTWLTHGSPYNH